MVGISFKRPVGPYADTKELEYICALHQSAHNIRPDGSIRAEDVQHFLSSRHGVRVREEVVSLSIIQEMGGSLPIREPIEEEEEEEVEDDVEKAKSGDNKDDKEEEEEEKEPEQPVLDICQITALLMIPFFRKGNGDEDVLVNSQTKMNASSQNQDEDIKSHHQAVVGYVLDVALRNILAELTSHGNGNVDTENHGVVMNTKVLRQALEIFGEYDVPNSILEEMIEQAQMDQNGMNPNELFFNKAAFLHALTYDTQLYNPEKIDDKESTHFDDARKAREYQQLALYGKKKELRRASVQPQFKDEEGNAHALPFETIYMASNIDNTADTYRSGTWFTLVWFETVLIYFGYMIGKTIQTSQFFDKCTNEFGCAVAKSLVGWIVVFLQLMLMGFTWVFMASLGNTTHPTETIMAKLSMSFRLLVGMGVVTFVCLVSFFEESDTQIWNTNKTLYTAPANWTSFLGGLLILCFQLLRLLGMYVPLGPFQAGGMEKKEKTTKAAASHKVLSLVEHAMLLHGDPSSNLQSMKASSVSPTFLDFATSLHASSGSKRNKSSLDMKPKELRATTNKALLNFHQSQDAKEDTGGVIWFAKRAINGTIFKQEGIFLHGRLMAVNCVQFFICALMVAIFIITFDVLNDLLGKQDTGCTIIVGEGGVEYPAFNRDWNTTVDGYENVYNINATHFALDPETQWFVFEGQLPKYNGVDFDIPGDEESPQICVNTEAGGAWIINSTGYYPNNAADYNQLIEGLGIKQHEWKGALAAGLLAAFAAVMGIACVYIPSFTSTVLKLRSGFSPSLKSDYDTFGVHRKSPDHTQILFGTNFWGCFVTAAFSFFLVSVGTFVCVWSVTWPYVRSAIALVMGMGATMFVKIVIMKILRGKFYSSFYRKKPAASNIMNVILECYALATSSFIVASRFIKLLIVTALYVGRVDTPMLAPGVGYIGPAPLDTAPNAFYIDLLSHEAHRHPFIERLGLLYLLKLYNGKKFGTRAGAYWRMLFVLALMPWMRNYRIRPEGSIIDDEDEEDDIISLSIRKQVQNEVDGMTQRDDSDMFGIQLEMDLTRRAYDKISKRNKDLKAALIAARDKVRELKQEKKALKRQLHKANSKAGSRASSKKSSVSMISEDEEDHKSDDS